MAAVVEAKNITKAFGGAKAVDDVSVSVSAGEIHAVVGENGAGKSTLMRILSGIEFADSGAVLVEGKEIENSAKASIDAGISLVHQELSLIPEMTVAENIFLGGFPTTAGFTKRNEMKKFASETLAEIGVEVDIDERISRLSVALRQFVSCDSWVSSSSRMVASCCIWTFRSSAMCSSCATSWPSCEPSKVGTPCAFAGEANPSVVTAATVRRSRLIRELPSA